MESTFRMRAFRLLAQDARLTPRTAHLLHTLMVSNPVALRGEPTMVASAQLIDVLNVGPRGAVAGPSTEADILESMQEIADAHWSKPSCLGFKIGVFIDGYALSRASGFVHFRIDPEFIVALKQISRQLRSGYDEPSAGLQ